MARKSRLGEILFGENAEGRRRRAHRAPEPAGHCAEPRRRMLNTAEKRLVTEWMDLGGQYYNDPFDAQRRARSTALSEATFEAQVHPDPASDLRGELPPGGRQHRLDGRRGHVVPQQPLRADRQTRRATSTSRCR